ncbi:MAG: hypothetical protein HY810_06875 [Candidatus Omnitrophica bacterium]|nr:hypothetical protein [Candidatus Omnitrophota bacterium]
MKKCSLLIIFLVFIFLGRNTCLAMEQQVLAEEKSAPKQVKELYVYSDKDSVVNSYYPSERIGDGESLEIDEADKENPQSGNTCVKIRYNATGVFGWAGIYWVNPSGNWGNEKGGYDLRFAKKLTFWARGEKGGEHIAVFRFGGLKGSFSDSDNHGIGPVILTREWKEYTVDVSTRNMKHIIAGFSFAISKAFNRQGCIFYLDEIKYIEE